MIIFEQKDYKAILKHFLTGPENRGRLTLAAKAAKCQRSFLSRVLNEPVHITSDLAFSLSEFLKFSKDECEYFLTLLEYERSGNPKHRQFLQEKLLSQRTAQEAIHKRTERTKFIETTMDTEYFSSWAYSAIHFLTSVPEFQTPDALANRLALKVEIVLDVLKKLAAKSLIEFKNNKWIYKAGEFHMEKGSPLAHFHYSNWRSRALEDAKWNKDSIHFAGIFTVNNDDYIKLKSICLDFIGKTSKIASSSEPQEGVALICDYFKI